MLICQYKGIRESFWQSEPTLPRNTRMTTGVLSESLFENRFPCCLSLGESDADFCGVWKPGHRICHCCAGAGKQGRVAGAGHFDDASLHVSLPLNDRSACLSASLHQDETFCILLPADPGQGPSWIHGSPGRARKGRMVHPKNMREGKTQGARRKRQDPGARPWRLRQKDPACRAGNVCVTN